MEDCLYCKIWKAMYCLTLEKYKILFENFPAQDAAAAFFQMRELQTVNMQKEILREDKDIVELVDKIEEAAEKGQVRIGNMEFLTEDLKKIVDKMMEEKEMFH